MSFCSLLYVAVAACNHFLHICSSSPLSLKLSVRFLHVAEQQYQTIYRISLNIQCLLHLLILSFNLNVGAIR